MNASLPRLALLLTLLALALPSPVAAEEGLGEVRVRTLEGPELGGTLAALDAEAVVLTTPSGPRRIPLDGVVTIRRGADGAGHPADARLRVRLVGGEVLLGRFAGGTAEGMRLDVEGIGPLALPFETLRSVARIPASAGPCYEPENDHAPQPGQDVVVLENGDTYEGLLLKVDGEGLELEGTTGATRRIPWDETTLVYLDNQVPPPPEGLQVAIETRDASVWYGAAPPVLEDGALHFALRSVPAGAVVLPLTEVKAIRPSGGRFVYACHLPFESRLETPYGDGAEDAMEAVFLERWFGARVDRRPSGCPLQLMGEVYPHGFAVHARSILTIALDGGFREFRCRFGVDDEALAVDAGGIVDARVLVDGREAWAAKGVRAGEAPRDVGPLAVEGASTLTLEVDYGPELHVRDRATWAEPILVR